MANHQQRRHQGSSHPWWKRHVLPGYSGQVQQVTKSTAEDASKYSSKSLNQEETEK